MILVVHLRVVLFIIPTRQLARHEVWKIQYFFNNTLLKTIQYSNFQYKSYLAAQRNMTMRICIYLYLFSAPNFGICLYQVDLNEQKCLEKSVYNNEEHKS